MSPVEELSQQGKNEPMDIHEDFGVPEDAIVHYRRSDDDPPHGLDFDPYKGWNGHYFYAECPECGKRIFVPAWNGNETSMCTGPDPDEYDPCGLVDWRPITEEEL